MPSYKSALVFLSLLLASTAHAVDEPSPIDVCKDMSIIAKEIMTARQKDKPMSETLPAAQKRFRGLMENYGFEVDEEADEMIAELVIGAYEAPSYNMTELQQSMISEFENSVFAECYKAAISDSED